MRWTKGAWNSVVRRTRASSIRLKRDFVEHGCTEGGWFMSDVDYRNASIATGIPVDTLKQFFKENDTVHP